jgi:hypothetical protein
MLFYLQGAAEMAQMEHLMNVYATKAAKGSIAEFLGYCEVSPREANSRLTEGLWLVSSRASTSSSSRMQISQLRCS